MANKTPFVVRLYLASNQLKTMGGLIRTVLKWFSPTVRKIEHLSDEVANDYLKLLSIAESTPNSRIVIQRLKAEHPTWLTSYLCSLITLSLYLPDQEKLDRFIGHYVLPSNSNELEQFIFWTSQMGNRVFDLSASWIKSGLSTVEARAQIKPQIIREYASNLSRHVNTCRHTGDIEQFFGVKSL